MNRVKSAAFRLAGMAAVAWENATILGWLQEENERLQLELKIEHGMVGVSDKLRDLQVDGAVVGVGA